MRFIGRIQVILYDSFLQCSLIDSNIGSCRLYNSFYSSNELISCLINGFLNNDMVDFILPEAASLLDRTPASYLYVLLV